MVASPWNLLYREAVMTPICPDIPPSAQFSASEAIRLLGISRGKFYAAVKSGLITGRIRRDNGRLQFTGRELIRYWKG